MHKTDPGSSSWAQARLSSADFTLFAGFIEEHCGIRMPPSKRIMVESRLRKRLRSLGMEGFSQYREYVLGSGGQDERICFIDAITTNKTDFFREPPHFEFLVRTALPELMGGNGAGVRQPLKVWSAACSTGEEPYTLAMVLAEVANDLPGFRFDILGTDISTRVLKRARQAVYPEGRVEPVPIALRRRHLLRSCDRSRGLVRIAPELRARVRFRQLNLLDEDFGLRERPEVIFCRNVMIYFDRSTQEEILKRFCRYLDPLGFLFLGHSESINGLRVPLTQRAPTVYQLAA